MNFWTYLLKNSKWALLFIFGLIAFVAYTYLSGSETPAAAFGVAGFFALIVAIILIGDYRNWKRLR